MTPIEFVKSLADAAPSVAALQGVGLSEAEAMNFRAGFLCEKRQSSSPVPAVNDLLGLMNNWDVSQVEVGMVRLLGSPVALSRGTQVGMVEADPLIISNPTGEMVVEEAGANGHVLWYAAQNAGQFLDALVTAARFLSDRTVGVVAFDDISAASSVAQDCTTRAGGDKYSTFYLMLLGAE